MPTVPYTSVFRVVCHQSFMGEESVNVWHILGDNTTDLTLTTAQAISTAFSNFYGGSSLGVTPDRGIDQYRREDQVLDRISVYDLRTVPNDPPWEFTHNNPGTGGVGDTPMDTTMCITLRTPNGTRRGRGRIFVGPTKDALSTGVGVPTAWSTAALAAHGNACVVLGRRLGALAAAPGPYLLAVLSVADGVGRPVTSVKIDPRPDTQRRRDLNLPFGPSTVLAVP
jgi:hypothetical protein